jgi:hypothetical protein
LWDSVRERVAKEQAKTNEYYDKRHYKAEGFFVGDMVVMSAPAPQTGEPRKAAPKYRGPLTIIEVLPGDTFRVAEIQETPGKQGYQSTAHISQLKVFRPSNMVVEDESGTTEGQSDGQSDDQLLGVDDASSDSSQSMIQSASHSPVKGRDDKKKRTVSETTIDAGGTPHSRRSTRKKIKNAKIYNNSFIS